jgi:hypothetical protein
MTWMALLSAVAATVEAVPHGSSAAGLQRTDAAKRGEGGVVAASTGVGEGHDDLGGADRPDARAGSQSGGEVLDDGSQLRAVGPQRLPGVAERDRESADLGLSYRLSAIGVASGAATDEAGEHRRGELSTGQLTVGVVAGQQQGTSVGLRGVDGGELIAGAEQDPQGFAVTVSARNGQPVGVQSQCGQHRKMSIDRVGFALPAPSAAGWLGAFDDHESGGHGRAGQAYPVAAGPLDGYDQPRAGSVLHDPVDQLGVTVAVVADRAGRQRCPGREGDFDFMSIAVGVDSDDGVEQFCQHGHRPVSFP